MSTQCENILARRTVRGRSVKRGRDLRGEAPNVLGRSVLSMFGIFGTAREIGSGIVPLVSQKSSMSLSAQKIVIVL